MNPFKAVLHESAKENNNHNSLAIRFSNLLKNSMQLSPEDIELAKKNNTEWNVGEFVISVEHRILDHSWQYLLEARPKGFPRLGYNGVPLPVGFEGVCQGTGSAIYPTGSIQDEILNEIDKMIQDS